MFIQFYHYIMLTILLEIRSLQTFQQPARNEFLKISYLPINCLFTVSKVSLRGALN